MGSLAILAAEAERVKQKKQRNMEPSANVLALSRL